MLNILKLFAKSPFAPLKTHMEKVSDCVHLLPTLFEAIEKEDIKGAEEAAKKISEKEHFADLTKNDIRATLPKSLFLAVDRSNLLEILSIQDSIADIAEDVAVLATLKPLPFYKEFKADFHKFLRKNIQAFDAVLAITKELEEILESSFGGLEAEKVRAMVDNVAYQEHEADLIQRDLLRSFFKVDDKLSHSNFHLWQRIFECIGAISNLSEKLAYRIRSTLELK